jgi:hypothetical protein
MEVTSMLTAISRPRQSRIAPRLPTAWGILDLVGGFLGKPGALIDLEQQGVAADHREPGGERHADQQDAQAGEI